MSCSDQGSTYSGDLESEARSTPFSWAETEDAGASVKPAVPATEEVEPAAATEDDTPPTTSLTKEQPDLENDFPLSEFNKKKKSILGQFID